MNSLVSKSIWDFWDMLTQRNITNFALYYLKIKSHSRSLYLGFLFHLFFRIKAQLLIEYYAQTDNFLHMLPFISSDVYIRSMNFHAPLIG